MLATSVKKSLAMIGITSLLLCNDRKNIPLTKPAPNNSANVNLVSQDFIISLMVHFGDEHIRQLVKTHQNQAVSLEQVIAQHKQLKHLKNCYHPDIISRVQVVCCDEIPMHWIYKVASRLGMDYTAQAPAAVTYGDLILVRNDHINKISLFLHELAHVVQWEQLGNKGFLELYLKSWRDNGYCYSTNTLERMAEEPLDLLVKKRRFFDMGKMIAIKCLALRKGDGSI